jgi:hypothetical protein
MDDQPVPIGEMDQRELMELLAQYDAPAYVRRARGVEAALENLLARCKKQRQDLLAMVRLRVGVLRALAGEWAVLLPYLGEEQVASLEQLHIALAPKLRVEVKVTSSRRTLRRALYDLNESIERFNRRWQVHLRQQDLDIINSLREGYNRYYILEKECALRSSALARKGFEPLPPFTLAELETLLPPLLVLKVRP